MDAPRGATTWMDDMNSNNETVQRAAYSVDEFCSAFGISRAYFYQVIKDGSGPATMKLGRRTLISVEAADAWRRDVESRTVAAAAA